MMKSSGTAAVGFLVVTVLWRLVIGGNPKSVWCRWKTPCLLEANFPIGDHVFIHWERWLPSKLQVHSFYYEKDQLQGQDQHFRGRTSLFKENIPKGNASLLLTNVLVADEGTYMCYVGTLTGQWRSFIKLNVEAAVTSIHFRLDDEDQLICSSGGIFPRPELRWSTEPALPDALRNSSQVQQETQTQLYNITGSLALAGDAHPDLKYICDINTVSSQRITWRKTTNRSTALQMLDCSILVGLILGLIVDLQGAMLFYQKMRANRSTSPEKLDLSMFSLALALIVLLQAATLVSQKMRANRSTSLQTSYWWIVGLVVALIVLELALTVLVLVAMLVYRKRRGKATKSSSRDPEEETELNSVKGVKVRRATNFLPEATTDRLDPRDPRPHPSTH